MKEGMDRKTKLIAIVGGIAVGKTTIGEKLIEKLDRAKFIEEDVSKNEFLPDFYADMKKWAFHSRMSTLAMIASNYITINDYNVVLMDRCLDELITFARLQYEKGNLSKREFKVYSQLYCDILAFAPKIDGYIYCTCPSVVSLKRIKSRNRVFEQGIELDYLDKLNIEYEKWINTLDSNKVFTVNTSYYVNIDEIKVFIDEL